MARPSPPRGSADVLRSRQPPADPAHRRRGARQRAADPDRGRRQPPGGVPGPGRRRRPAPASCCCRTSAASIRSTRSWPCGFAEHGHRRPGHRLVRPDGARRRPRRGLRAHAARPGARPGPGSPPTSPRASAYLREPDAARRPASRLESSRSASAWAAGCRSSPATLGLGLAGVIGFYGTLVGPWRNDAPAPVDVAASIASPVLGLFGGADGAITPEAIAAFDAALTTPRHASIASSATRARRTASSTARRPSSRTPARRRGPRRWRSSPIRTAPSPPARLRIAARSRRARSPGPQGTRT